MLFLVNGLFSSSYVLPSRLLRMGFSPWRTGVLMSAFFAGAFATRPAAGRMVEKLGVGKCVLAAALPGAAAGAAMLARGFAPLLLSRFCLGMAGGVLYVAQVAYQGLAIGTDERGRAAGPLTLASVLPQFLLVPFAERLLDSGAARVFMLLPSFALLLSAAFALSLPKDAVAAVAGREREWGGWGELLARRGTWALLASFFIESLTSAAACQYVPNLMRSLGLRGGPYSQTFTLFSVLIRLTLCAWAMTAFDRRRTFTVFAAIESASLILSARAANVPAFVFSGAVFGLSHGLVYPAIVALLPDTVPTRLMPKGASAFLLMYDVASILMPLAIGGFGPRGAIFAAGALGVGAFPLIYIFLWRPGVNREREASS